MKTYAKVQIKWISNGYLVKNLGEDGETTVIQEKSGEFSQDERQQAFTELIYELAELFGISYDGFKPDNLNISWDKKGDELE